jgi:hypothetical protein
VTFWFLVRMLLDRCATVKEGIALLEETPHCASWTYLLRCPGGCCRGGANREGSFGKKTRERTADTPQPCVCPEWAAQSRTSLRIPGSVREVERPPRQRNRGPSRTSGMPSGITPAGSVPTANTSRDEGSEHCGR